MKKKLLFIAFLVVALTGLYAEIGWSGNIWPNSGSNHVNGNDIAVYYQIYKGGTTDAAGQGADISATLYFRLQGETTFSSVAMSYNGDVGSNDEYTAVLPNTAFDSSDVVEWYCEGLDETDMTYSYGTDQSGAGPFTETNLGTYNITAGTNQDVTVTFQVDMSVQSDVTSVFLAGSFNEWNSSATEMTLQQDEIYTVDVLFPAGSNYEQTYKFVKNGTDWENDPNRVLTINDAAPTQILDVVYFNDEEPPTVTTQDVTVTFQVDMSVQQGVTSVHLAGDFTGWGDSPIQMFINSRNVYTVDVLFPSGSNISQEYKFIMNETEWESIPNRELTIDDASSTQILDVVYFNDVEPQEVTTQDVTVTFQIYMGGLDLGWYENGVSVQGSVSPLDWIGGSNELTEVEGVYTVDVLFPAGSTYGVDYKFARLDGDEIWNFETFDGNRYFEIDDSGATQTLQIHYWNNVIPEPEVTITMNGDDAELSWDAIPGVTGYNIFRDEDAYGTFENQLNFLPLASPSYTDENVQETKYFYRVKAIQE